MDDKFIWGLLLVIVCLNKANCGSYKIERQQVTEITPQPTEDDPFVNGHPEVPEIMKSTRPSLREKSNSRTTPMYPSAPEPVPIVEPAPIVEEVPPAPETVLKEETVSQPISRLEKKKQSAEFIESPHDVELPQDDLIIQHEKNEDGRSPKLKSQDVSGHKITEAEYKSTTEYIDIYPAVDQETPTKATKLNVDTQPEDENNEKGKSLSDRIKAKKESKDDPIDQDTPTIEEIKNKPNVEIIPEPEAEKLKPDLINSDENNEKGKSLSDKIKAKKESKDDPIDHDTPTIEEIKNKPNVELIPEPEAEKLKPDLINSDETNEKGKSLSDKIKAKKESKDDPIDQDTPTVEEIKNKPNVEIIPEPEAEKLKPDLINSDENNENGQSLSNKIKAKKESKDDPIVQATPTIEEIKNKPNVDIIPEPEAEKLKPDLINSDENNEKGKSLSDKIKAKKESKDDSIDQDTPTIEHIKNKPNVETIPEPEAEKPKPDLVNSDENNEKDQSLSDKIKAKKESKDDPIVQTTPTIEEIKNKPNVEIIPEPEAEKPKPDLINSDENNKKGQSVSDKIKAKKESKDDPIVQATPTIEEIKNKPNVDIIPEPEAEKLKPDLINSDENNEKGKPLSDKIKAKKELKEDPIDQDTPIIEGIKNKPNVDIIPEPEIEIEESDSNKSDNTNEKDKSVLDKIKAKKELKNDSKEIVIDDGKKTQAIGNTKPEAEDGEFLHDLTQSDENNDKRSSLLDKVKAKKESTDKPTDLETPTGKVIKPNVDKIPDLEGEKAKHDFNKSDERNDEKPLEKIKTKKESKDDHLPSKEEVDKILSEDLKHDSLNKSEPANKHESLKDKLDKKHENLESKREEKESITKTDEKKREQKHPKEIDSHSKHLDHGKNENDAENTKKHSDVDHLTIPHDLKKDDDKEVKQHDLHKTDSHNPQKHGDHKIEKNPHQLEAHNIPNKTPKIKESPASDIHQPNPKIEKSHKVESVKNIKTNKKKPYEFIPSKQYGRNYKPKSGYTNRYSKNSENKKKPFTQKPRQPITTQAPVIENHPKEIITLESHQPINIFERNYNSKPHLINRNERDSVDESLVNDQLVDRSNKVQGDNNTLNNDESVKIDLDSSNNNTNIINNVKDESTNNYLNKFEGDVSIHHHFYYIFPTDAGNFAIPLENEQTPSGFPFQSNSNKLVNILKQLKDQSPQTTETTQPSVEIPQQNTQTDENKVPIIVNVAVTTNSQVDKVTAEQVGYLDNDCAVAVTAEENNELKSQNRVRPLVPCRLCELEQTQVKEVPIESQVITVSDQTATSVVAGPISIPIESQIITVSDPRPTPVVASPKIPITNGYPFPFVYPNKVVQQNKPQAIYPFRPISYPLSRSCSTKRSTVRSPIKYPSYNFVVPRRI